jgi:hypothetical protein
MSNVFHLGDRVRVRLTETGEACWFDYWSRHLRSGAPAHLKDSPTGPNGTTEIPLWELIQVFGEYTGLGMKPCFVDNEIIIERE